MASIASELVQRRPKDWLANVLVEDLPFRAALSSFGYDSRYREAAVRNRAGELFHIWLDFDVTGQFGADGSNAALTALRCNRITLGAGSMGPGSHFNLEGCDVDDILSPNLIGRGGPGWASSHQQ
ncbi:hypothetical protein C7S18_15645 [Ahniella affigens]|uniref:Uncharacterized protein n=1 Tax=Ahniella affigens TaxID=2021234 RepID=A0A2P1PUM0_9GAMM|nr:hypothetical protein [Ahniella affigens]AVP98531.1 hypothetical protein C7S18_15645 [Ahniella affigens]